MPHGPFPVLRDRDAPGSERVNFVELFFDLVFVFAVTQLSHGLLEHTSVEGALETLFLMLAVWTVWMWTTWITSWLETRSTSVRLLLFAIMAAGLVMSVSIPEAFGEHGIYFALAYVAIHHGRTLFVVWALRKGKPNERRNFERIEVWMLVSVVPWIAGGFLEGEARWALWLLGLGIDLGAPWWRFWVPGWGGSKTEDWTIKPAHMAERCGLFVILSLGESIIILGATFAGHEWTWAAKAAFGVGFLGEIAMWWIYFATTAEAADEAFLHHRDAGRVARAAYTYAHIPIVAGIILTAVADELVLAHPTGHVATATLAAALGGPALFLGGSAVFYRLACGAVPLSHLAGLALLAAGVPLAPQLSPLALATATMGVLVLVGAWETIAPASRGRPSKASASD
jgi:low temperature requirement protein LtrA